MPALARDALEASGLPTREIPALDERAGHAQMVRRFEGRLLAGTDPRADGAALAD
jgi:gamma-glutamyltranspeptidase